MHFANLDLPQGPAPWPVPACLPGCPGGDQAAPEVTPPAGPFWALDGPSKQVSRPLRSCLGASRRATDGRSVQAVTHGITCEAAGQAGGCAQVRRTTSPPVFFLLSRYLPPGYFQRGWPTRMQEAFRMIDGWSLGSGGDGVGCECSRNTARPWQAAPRGRPRAAWCAAPQGAAVRVFSRFRRAVLAGLHHEPARNRPCSLGDGGPGPARVESKRGPPGDSKDCSDTVWPERPQERQHPRPGQQRSQAIHRTTHGLHIWR